MFYRVVLNGVIEYHFKEIAKMWQFLYQLDFLNDSVTIQISTHIWED